jgi:hypothetical protein
MSRPSTDTDAASERNLHRFLCFNVSRVSEIVEWDGAENVGALFRDVENFPAFSRGPWILIPDGVNSHMGALDVREPLASRHWSGRGAECLGIGLRTVNE